MTGTKLETIVLVLVFGVFIFVFSGKAVVAQQKTETAPAFALKLLNGGELKSTDFAGKVAVLKFKASW